MNRLTTLGWTQVDPLLEAVVVGRTRRFAALAGLAILSTLLAGCSGTSTPIAPTPGVTQTPSLQKSSMSPAAGTISMTALKSAFNGTSLIASGAITGGCDVTAGDTQMRFTATASSSWFQVTPTVGTIPANGRTTIGIASLNATSLPDGLNTGVVLITAPGYEDNSRWVIHLDYASVDTQGNALFRYTSSCS